MEENFIRQVQQVSDSMKLVFDLTSRIDERLKALIESTTESKERIEKLFENHTALISRIVVLESKNGSKDVGEMKNDLKKIQEEVFQLTERMGHVEKEIGTQTNRWSNIADFAFKIAQIVIGAIILWKLGIKP